MYLCSGKLQRRTEKWNIISIEQETLKEPKLDIKNDNYPKKSINNDYDIENILTNEELSQNKENILENIWLLNYRFLLTYIL